MKKYLILLALVGGVAMARAKDHLGRDRLLTLAPADTTTSSGEKTGAS